MTIITEFDFFDIVYIKTDAEQRPGQVIGMEIKPGPLLVYNCQCGPESSDHYTEELERKPNQLTKLK